jgi:hypothetical protein
MQGQWRGPDGHAPIGDKSFHPRRLVFALWKCVADTLGNGAAPMATRRSVTKVFIRAAWFQ